MDICRTVGSRSLSVTAMLKKLCFFRLKRIQQSTDSVRTTRHCGLNDGFTSPANTDHLYNICTTSAQRLRRWSNIVQMLYMYKWFVFAGSFEQQHINVYVSNRFTCIVQSLSYNPVYILMYLKFLNGFM